MSARKDDANKPPLSLIPRSALLAEARVLAKGAAKYGKHNWRSDGGLEWSRLLDAAMRHIEAFVDGEDYDDGEGGSGELHLANARCCLAFLIEYYEKGTGKDDRYKQSDAEFFQVVNAGVEQAMDHVNTSTVWEVWAKGHFTGTGVLLGVYPTENGALNALNFYKPEWPTFTLYIQEVSQ